MKTPVLTLLPKHTAELLDASISSALKSCSACATHNTTCDASVQQTLYGLCYKIFFYEGKFSVNKKYTISDACIFIPGIFKLEMIRFLTDIVNYCESETLSLLETLLSNCFSLELIQMLYNNPVQVYASWLYVYGLKTSDKELLDLGKFYLAEVSTQPTLDWECMYLKFMERYE